MLEVSTTCITPEIVLKSSGHVDKFTDLLVTDTKTKEPFRADKIIIEILEQRINSKNTKPEEISIYKNIINTIDSFKQD